MNSMFSNAAAFNQPLSFDTANVVDVRFCLQSNPICNKFSIHYNQSFYQMAVMFSDASAFNQPLYFNTSSVTNVRVICFDFIHNDEPGSDRFLLLPTYLVIRRATCFTLHWPSISQ